MSEEPLYLTSRAVVFVMFIQLAFSLEYRPGCTHVYRATSLIRPPPPSRNLHVQ